MLEKRAEPYLYDKDSNRASKKESKDIDESEFQRINRKDVYPRKEVGSRYNYTSDVSTLIDKKIEDNSNFTGVRLDTSHAQYAKIEKEPLIDKKTEDNSNFTGVRLDTSHAQFAKESKMNKHVKGELTLKGEMND